MLNNPPELTTGQLPSAVPQSAQDAHYMFGHQDYLGSESHRWLIPFDIGTVVYNGSNAMQTTQGLAAGQSMVVSVDQLPDRWVVVVWGEGAAGVAANFGVRIARVVLGGASGGSGYQLGAGGKLKIPAQGHTQLTITNVATAAVTLHGTIIAVGGFDFGDIDVG